jgi:hypothetical protein
MIRARWRLGVGIYLVSFLAAAVVSPHHHLNGFEDLVLDQPSDSGTVVETDAPVSGSVPILGGFRIVDDVPCLACFAHDFAAAPAPHFAFTRTLQPLSKPPDPAPRPLPEPVSGEPSSRAPPAAA